MLGHYQYHAVPGNFTEAEHHLQLTPKLSRFWWTTAVTTSNDILLSNLAQFYEGRTPEQACKKAEAINTLQEFLSPFENSTAKLPQIAEASAAAVCPPG